MWQMWQALILCSDLTNHQEIHSELKSYSHSEYGKCFTKYEKIHTGEKPCIQTTVSPSSLKIKIGWNRITMCVDRASVIGVIIHIIREFIIQRHLTNVRVWQILQMACRPKKTPGHPYSRTLPNVISVASFCQVFTS